jgi:aryl-alcohol dehydrogenase-like predicted oxidoreductase
MQYRFLGNTGLRVSALCLGSMQFGWNVDEPTSHAILDTFVAAGGTFIDTADIYSRWVEGNPGGVSEEMIGRWMQQRRNRYEVIIATKGAGPMWSGPTGEGLSRTHLLRAVDDSLRRLQTDYIDLYQTHWYDANTPIEETLGTLTDLVRAGKIRYLGCSNIPAWRLMQALWAGERRALETYISLQPHYNLAHRAEFERELRDVCQTYRLGVLPYSPLAAGFLTGKYRPESTTPESVRANSVQQKYANERGWAILRALDAAAAEHGGQPMHVALAWLLAQPTVTAPVLGARSIEQLNEQLAALDLDLSAETLAALDRASAEE